MSEINVVYICNDAYMPMTGISIYSLLENNKKASEIHIYLAGDNISSQNSEKLMKLINCYNRQLHYIDISNICKKMDESGIKKYKGKTYSPYLKNFMANEVNRKVNRLLYIDSDTIIDNSIEALFTMELDKPIYMVADIMWDFRKRVLGMEKDAFYYNGGIILYNIPEWEERNCFNRYWDFLCNSPHQFTLGDQDITNLLFSKADISNSEIGTLPLKFNYFLKKQFIDSSIKEAHSVFYTQKEIENIETDAIIYHFSKYNGERPWEKDNVHPFRDKFLYYKNQSPWSDFPEFENKRSKIMDIQIKLKNILPEYAYIPILRTAQKWYFFKSERQLNK